MTTLYDYEALQKENKRLKDGCEKALSWLESASNYELPFGGVEELIELLRNLCRTGEKSNG